MLLVPLRNIHADSYQLGQVNLPNTAPCATYSGPYSSPLYPYPVQNSIYQPTSSCVPVHVPLTSCNLVESTSHPYSNHPSPARRVPISSGTRNGFSSHSPSPVSSPSPSFESSNSILYSLLNQTDQGYSSNVESTSGAGSPVSIHSDSALDTGGSNTPQPVDRRVTSRFVGLKNPQETCNVASKVLVKTVNFIKNLSSYKNLCENDQMLLFRDSWAELLIVGLAQENISYETVEYELTVLPTETADDASSSLHALPILQQQKAPRAEEAAKLKSFIQRCWELNLSAAEYAYFMGTVLFDPNVAGLQQKDLIASLQMEAQHALLSLIHI